jgi:hypothetical protein
MPYSVAGKNKMLDALVNPAGFVSLHSAYPGDTGASEISGGSPAYARKAKTWNAAAAGAVDDSNAPVLDVPAATTIGWLGFWSLSTAGVFYGYAPAGGTPYRYTLDLTLNKVQVTAHGLVADNKIVFINGTAPTGLTEGTVYFVKAPTANDFEVSATAGGAAIDITAAGAAASRVSKIVEETFAAQGTYTQTDADFDLSDA